MRAFLFMFSFPGRLFCCRCKAVCCFSQDILGYKFAIAGFTENTEKQIAILVITFSFQPLRPAILFGELSELGQVYQLQGNIFFVGFRMSL